MAISQNQASNLLISSENEIQGSRLKYSQRKDPYPVPTNPEQDFELRKKLTMLIPSTLNNLLSENYSLYKQFLKINTIDSYFNIVSGGHPVVGRKVLEDFLFTENPYNNTELMALVFSIQALVEQRLGRRERAMEDINISKQLLSSLFDKCDDFFVVSTFNYISYFFAGEGDDSRARFYLNNVDYYFKEKNLLDHDNLTPEMKNLDKVKTVTRLSIDSQNYHSTEDEHFMCTRLTLIYRYATGRQMPGEYMTIAKQKITPQNVISYLGLLDSVCSFLTLHNQTFSFTPEQRELATITDSMVYHGSRMRILIEAGIRGHLIEVSANKIIDETTKETFPVVPVALTSVVAGACKVHLSIIRMIRVGKRVNLAEGIDYYDYVAKGLRALKILGTRYGRVNKFCGIIMKEQAEVIEGTNTVNSIEELTSQIAKRQQPPTQQPVINTQTAPTMNPNLPFGNVNPQPPRFEEIMSSSSSSTSSPYTSSSSSGEFQSPQQAFIPINPTNNTLNDPSVSELLSQICNTISVQASSMRNNSIQSQQHSFDVNMINQTHLPPSFADINPQHLQHNFLPTVTNIPPTYGSEVFMPSEELEQILGSFENEEQNFNDYD